MIEFIQMVILYLKPRKNIAIAIAVIGIVLFILAGAYYPRAKVQEPTVQISSPIIESPIKKSEILKPPKPTERPTEGKTHSQSTPPTVQTDVDPYVHNKESVVNFTEFTHNLEIELKKEGYDEKFGRNLAFHIHDSLTKNKLTMDEMDKIISEELGDQSTPEAIQKVKSLINKSVPPDPNPPTYVDMNQ